MAENHVRLRQHFAPAHEGINFQEVASDFIFGAKNEHDMQLSQVNKISIGSHTHFFDLRECIQMTIYSVNTDKHPD